MDGKGRTNVRMRNGRVRKEVMKLREVSELAQLGRFVWEWSVSESAEQGTEA